MEFGIPQRKRRQVNLTPLIDMMFLLVIFFMLTTSFGLTNLLQIQMAEEKTAAVSEQIPAAKISIMVEAPAKTFLDGKELNHKDFDVALGEKLKDDPSREVLIETKDGVTVQTLVAILDRMNVFGAGNVTLAEAE